MGGTPSRSMNDFVAKFDDDTRKKYFSGTWHEQGRLYAPFERDCRGVKAHYKILDDGTIHVTNECMWNSDIYKMEGQAYPMIKNSDMASFYVKFPWVPAGGYFVIYAEHVDKKNGIAFVAGRNFNYFWVLTRNKVYDKARVCYLLKELKLPIDYDKLIWNDGEKCFTQ
jgi:lipocalin